MRQFFILLLISFDAYSCSIEPTNWTCDNDLRILSEAIYFEARGESWLGQTAIALVINNRVNHPKFPNTIKGVVYHNRRPYKLNKCQFSYWCDGKKEIVVDFNAWNHAVENAMMVYYNFIDDHTHGADHYHNPVTSVASWYLDMTLTTEIEKHAFYKR